jgi:hypothetical protein
MGRLLIRSRVDLRQIAAPACGIALSALRASQRPGRRIENRVHRDAKVHRDALYALAVRFCGAEFLRLIDAGQQSSPSQIAFPLKSIRHFCNCDKVSRVISLTVTCKEK